ncbi:MAG TPA: hypothetical protein PKD51_09305 [Saprospiraceae bacterium]|nr:hypothetical protein [Saprospiraceae bacterium]
MNKLKILFFTFFAIAIMVGIYSCAKEGSSVEAKTQELTVENRSSGSACSPETIYPIFTGCTNVQRNIPIDFSAGLDLYSNGSTLFQLCPGVQFNVYYTFTTCNFGAGKVHFVHNLTYNIADIIAACPALQTAINNQQALGNLVSFLDLLDFDISKQVEFTEAYNAAIQASPTKYLCENGSEFYNIKYIKNTCYKWDAIPNPKTGEFIFVKRECNGSICCIRIGQYCVIEFSNGQPVLQFSGNSTYERKEGECPQDCTHECGNPNTGDI